MAWEPDRRSNSFFSPPAHLCAVTYMTEISLIVTLNNQCTHLTGELVAAGIEIVEASEGWDTRSGIKEMAGLEKATGSDGKLLRLEVDEAVTRGSEDRDTISDVDVVVELDEAASLRVTDAQ